MKKINNIKKIIEKYSKIPNFIIKKKKNINITGRIINKRKMKKSIFLNIQDIEGNIQIFIKKDKNYKKYKNIKIGDIIYVNGKLFKTKTKELTIKSKKIKILTKTKKYWPDKFNKIKKKEKKFRQRYLDLIINEKSRQIFIKRIKIINLIRKYLNNKKFLEVETPMLHIIPGGASAKPFKTYHSKLKTNMYLRIAPEIFLKKLIIGGFNKIFELNRNFRNEGISSKHNPEFTMIEIYKTYENYKYMMKLTENIISYVINSLFKKNILLKKKINIINPYKIITLKKAIYKFSKLFNKLEDLDNNDKIIEIAKKININIKKNNKIGKILIKIFENTTEKKLIKPTFVTEYPSDISYLSKKNIKNKKIADRFELFINGYEIANGFSELNNYKEQKENFKKQLENKKKNIYDKEYINALKYGLPPTAGVGIGIDRLVMIITKSKSIKDVILFPSINK